MSERLKQLQALEVQLHEVNEEFAKAARPLDRLAEMNLEQRRKVADDLRIQFARWESVAQAISQVMGTGGANGHGMAKGNESEPR